MAIHHRGIQNKQLPIYRAFGQEASSRYVAVYRNTHFITLKIGPLTGELFPLESFESKAAYDDFYFKIKAATASRRAELGDIRLDDNLYLAQLK